MTNRKEISVFSMSFIDLISGALGAVLILYIIIPKLNITPEAFEEQKEIIDAVNSLGKTVDELKNSVSNEIYDKIVKEIGTIKKAKEELDQKIKSQAKNLIKCKKDQKELKEVIEGLEDKIKALKEELGKCPPNHIPYHDWMENCGFTFDMDCPRAEECPPCPKCPPPPPPCPKYPKTYEEYYNWMNNCDLNINSKCPPKTVQNIDAGFKYKGKNIVFVVDVSGSMGRDNKINQVQFGLQMLLTTMDASFKIDIIKYPGGTGIPYLPMWGSTRNITPSSRIQATEYLRSLIANGCTPTRPTLKYVLSSYASITDIVFLTDGAPSLMDSSCTGDDVSSILSEIKRSNTKNVRINAVGIGKDFVNNPSSLAVQFVKNLASQNDGFYVGF